jgi:hypothetical protein
MAAMTKRQLDSYKKLCTEFYDLDKTGPPQPAFDFYWGRFERTSGPALEAMCGSGRFLVPFAQRGADIDGVDASPHMLAACRRKAASAGVSPGIYEQFLQEMDLPRKYQFVFCPAGSFQLIPHGEQAASLMALVEHMEPGAELVLEMGFPGETRTGPSSADGERRVTRPDGAEIVLSSDASGMTRYDLVRDGEILETELETFVLYPTPRDEFEQMLRDAGLTSIRAWWPYSEEYARPNAPFAVYVCEKGAQWWIGAIFPQLEIGSDPVVIRDYAQAVEGMGFDHILAYDHVLGAHPDRFKDVYEGRFRPPYTYKSTFHEPFVLFGYLAAITTRSSLRRGS